MTDHPLVLADQDRHEQFTLLSRRRSLFQTLDTCQDAQGVVWASARAGECCFAVSLLGPGWVFDPYARQRRAEIFAERSRAMENADAAERQRQLQRVISQLRLGPIAERVLWAIYSRVMQSRRSVVKIPDRRLARLVWGTNADALPRHWRGTLREVLRSLTWLHVAGQPAEGPPTLGQHSALLTHAADLKGKPADGCDDDCPELGGPAHTHFVINTGRGFLGILEQFATVDDATGIRTYEFKVRGKKSAGPTLTSVGKTGKLVNIYLPAKLGEPVKCSTLDHRQHDLLQTIVRETTRNTKAKRTDIAEAELNTSNKIPAIQRTKSITCHLLDPTGHYVGFNGNGKRRGLGYGLLTAGGWLVKAGYDLKDVAEFLTDLAVLVESLGLIAVGIHVATNQIFDLDQLRALARRNNGRQTLRKTHLRIYAAADYIQRWNAFFGWPDETVLRVVTPVDAGAELMTALKRSGITQRALAAAIDLDPSFVNKLLRGQRTWPANKLAEAQSWLAQQGGVQNGAVQDDEPEADQGGMAERSANASSQPTPMTPLLTAVTNGTITMLEVALAYRSRGWSVVPQQPGAKQPCVKWKSFQERRPTDDEINAWLTNWPNAGLAVVLGPVSNLFVVDVDGSDAHHALVERLTVEPLAPKVISGSRQPDRYHLFFRCPAVRTKAKSTPWHSKLEFRGQGGVLVIPPSLHPSGNRYEWARGQSIDDLELAELPAEILAALQSPPPSVSNNNAIVNENIDAASPTTREFLTGKYAQGPNWNDRLFRAACDLVGRGMAREEAEPLLLAGAQPWDTTEAENARRTIASAFDQAREPAKY